MRVIGGEWKGRTIRPPRGRATRPTTDRVREALFDALSARIGHDFSAEVVLDAFAGSGALGLEALSRGAGHATFVERGAPAVAALRRNIAELRAESRCAVVQSDVLSLAGHIVGAPFTLIMLDPPYTLDAAAVSTVLSGLHEAASVSDGAWVTWEHSAGAPAAWPEGYSVDTTKRYGSTEIEFALYEREAGE